MFPQMMRLTPLRSPLRHGFPCSQGLGIPNTQIVQISLSVLPSNAVLSFSIAGLTRLIMDLPFSPCGKIPVYGWDSSHHIPPRNLSKQLSL